MSNKKSIRLTTIHLNHCINLPETEDTPPALQINQATFLLPSKRPTRPVQSSSGLTQKNHSNLKLYKQSKKQPFFIDRLKQLEINQIHIEKYFPSRQARQSQIFYQQFPKRSNPIKNGNAFKFFLNSVLAHRNYSEQIFPLQKIHNKLSQIVQMKPQALRPSTGIVRCQTEPVNQLVKQNIKISRPQSSLTRNPVKAKRQICVTVPQIGAWQTEEQKILTQW